MEVLHSNIHLYPLVSLSWLISISILHSAEQYISLIITSIFAAWRSKFKFLKVSYEAPVKLLHFISLVYSRSLSRDNYTYIHLGVLTEFIKMSN